MSSYIQSIHHIIFTPYKRQPILTKEKRPELFKYVTGILKEKKCHLYQINGVEDHIHILTHIHPTVALSDLVKDIKIASGKMIKREGLFEKFQGWQNGYGGFTHSFKEKERLVPYIIKQEEHHEKVSFLEEFIRILEENGVEYDPKYLD
ncbi:IS200/IS605 family transposase [Cyclobacterium roseum]|uniref:IS200/IS605 family transposase n=1 Tax=Cyclobacterium roseum TaxID=2666137 RepID=UPI001391DD34|nr:IS200/IS605 family transposase [Cyclobacterium roseum]